MADFGEKISKLNEGSSTTRLGKIFTQINTNYFGGGLRPGDYHWKFGKNSQESERNRHTIIERAGLKSIGGDLVKEIANIEPSFSKELASLITQENVFTFIPIYCELHRSLNKKGFSINLKTSTVPWDLVMKLNIKHMIKDIEKGTSSQEQKFFPNIPSLSKPIYDQEIFSNYDIGDKQIHPSRIEIKREWGTFEWDMEDTSHSANDPITSRNFPGSYIHISWSGGSQSRSSGGIPNLDFNILVTGLNTLPMNRPNDKTSNLLLTSTLPGVDKAVRDSVASLQSNDFKLHRMYYSLRASPHLYRNTTLNENSFHYGIFSYSKLALIFAGILPSSGLLVEIGQTLKQEDSPDSPFTPLRSGIKTTNTNVSIWAHKIQEECVPSDTRFFASDIRP